MALRSDEPLDGSRQHNPAASSVAQSMISGSRSRHDAESWVEISSQPSSSSLSSAADDLSTTNLRKHSERRLQRRIHRSREGPAVQPKPESTHGASSQEEYDESESESDRIMTSSGEGPLMAVRTANIESDDDENRTAINYPINGNSFTPQPNAFSHPPSAQSRSASQPVPGSYFPSVNRSTAQADASRQRASTQSHLPRNILSPSYNAAAHHDEALRNSLSTLLSCAAAARGLKTESKSPAALPETQQRKRNQPMTLRLVPESALPNASPSFDLQAPVFKPTLRRHSTTTTSTSPDRAGDKAKRTGRASSKERRVAKKVRRSSSAEELTMSPTLLTWVVSAGVVVVLSALSFSAGYTLGKEAGRMEGGGVAGGLHVGGNGDVISDCAREASRTGGLGLKRSLARSAVQV